jgi:protein involved in polysaccharide export with SLBB domain
LVLGLAFAASLAAPGCRTAGTDPELAALLKDGRYREYAEERSPEAPDRPDTPVKPPPPQALAAPETGLPELTLQKDCLLQINVEEDPGLDGTYQVNDIGAIQLSYIGPVILFNRTEKEAETKIREILEYRAFKNATVKVRILRASYDRIKILGAVAVPGLVSIGAGDTILLNEALLRANGVQGPVKDVKVKVVRGGLLDVAAQARDGEEYVLVDEQGKPHVPEVKLRNNDVVYVSARTQDTMGQSASVESRTVLVLGEVSRKGFYTFTGSEAATVMNLVFKMGGFPRYANDKAIKVIRRDRSGNEEEFVVDAADIMRDGDPAKDFALENGDRVIVPARRLSLLQ